VSGGGKTVMSRFVAWMNGLSIFTIKVNNRYKASDFDEDLRTVMKRAGCKEEKYDFTWKSFRLFLSWYIFIRSNMLICGQDLLHFRREQRT
jgi:dynein heavy chain 1